MDFHTKTPFFDLDGIREYMARKNPPRTAIVHEMILRKEKFHLDEMKSFISFGPAAGDMDVEVLTAFPGCRFYTGVELDERSAALLGKNMKKKYPQIKSTVVQGRAELWEGPADQVDVVFLAHVLYNMPRLGELLQRVVTWIRPGGLLITLQAGQNNGWPNSTLPSGARVFNGTSHPSQTDLLRELHDLKQVKVEGEIDNPCMFDIRTPNLHLANFLMEKECNTEEMYQLFDHLKSYDTSGCGRIPATETLTILVKES